MKKQIVLFLLISSLSANAQIDTTKLLKEPPDSTGFGNPDGKAVSQQIGVAGGHIVSDDGRVEVDFPDSALEENMTITIQPTTNFAPNGTGKAYQFEPSGLAFRRPVTIIFHYTNEEADTCPPELMAMAGQDNSGKWKIFDYDVWDSSANTIQGQILHFSAYTKINKAKLVADLQEVQLTKKTFLHVIDLGRGGDLPTNYISASFYNSPVVWYVNGIEAGNHESGIIEGENLHSSANGVIPAAWYTAPELFPRQNPVTITAKVLVQSRKDKNMMYAKDLKCRVFLYDMYAINVSELSDNMALYGATEKLVDTASITILFNNKPGGSPSNAVWQIHNLHNTFYILEEEKCQPKCSCEYLSREYCKGPLDIQGVKDIKISDDGKTVSVFFTPAKAMFPLFKISCKTGSRFVPSIPLPPLPALPERVEFQLGDGEQDYKIGSVGEGALGNIKTKITRVTE